MLLEYKLRCVRLVRFGGFIPLIVALAGCGSMTFKMVSEPEGAEVFVTPVSGPDGTPVAGGEELKKSIGKTPLELPLEEMEKTLGTQFAGQAVMRLSVEKPGFVSESLTVPSPRMATAVELKVKLKEGTGPAEQKTARKILDSLFLAQKLALTQQYERAHVEIDKVVAEHPSFARALSMRASIYFAQQNFPEAVKWYEAAISADPQLDEAVRLLGRAKAMMAGRAPAGAGNR